MLAAGVILTSLFLFPQPTLAFDPEYLLSDSDLENSYSLSLDQIQAYLDRGYLGDYEAVDYYGVERPAAEIIRNAALEHDISPKFLLVLIQKEQSLVEDDSPTQSQLDWAAGYAVCDSCSKDDPAIQRWKGFGKQVNAAAAQFRQGYLTDIEIIGVTYGKYGPGIPVEIDGETIVPQNAATAAMYAYTPHFHGNENFVDIWTRWFGLDYPTGSLLRAEGTPGVYLIEYGAKRPITSWSALVTRFNPNNIIEVAPYVLDNYSVGQEIGFPNYSLLQDEDGAVYLLVDDTLRPIDSIETFNKIGFMEDQIVAISNEDVEGYEIGTTITAATADPAGKVLKTASGTLFYAQDGVRHLIPDTAVYEARFAGTAIVDAAPGEIEQYKEGDALGLPDGYLVKSVEDPTVYVVSEGKLRSIPSEGVFLSYGWSWDRIVTVEEKSLKLHETGEAIPDVSGLTIASQ